MIQVNVTDLVSLGSVCLIIGMTIGVLLGISLEQFEQRKAKRG